MASDKNHRPCLPLKPQEKKFKAIIYKLKQTKMHVLVKYEDMKILLGLYWKYWRGLIRAGGKISTFPETF
jgi:hypothetical protein